MTDDEVLAIAEEIRGIMERFVQVMHERAFLRRVLRQLVLQHGGELHVDTSFALAAINDNRTLLFGGEKVTLEDTKYIS